MMELDEISRTLGIDPESRDARLSDALADEHYRLIEELVRHRVRQQISQECIADRLGVSQPTISAFEKLGKDVKLSTIRRYALAVGVEVKHIVDRFEAEESESSTDDKVVHLNFNGVLKKPSQAIIVNGVKVV